MGEGSPFLVLPDLSEDGSHYLVDLWHEAGTIGRSGSGVSELSWSEIIQWANQFYSEFFTEYVPIGDDRYSPVTTKECSLLAWELLTIKELSSAYAAEYMQATDKDRPAPHIDISDETIDRVAMSNKFKGILRSLKKDDNQPRYEVEDR